MDYEDLLRRFYFAGAVPLETATDEQKGAFCDVREEVERALGVEVGYKLAHLLTEGENEHGH